VVRANTQKYAVENVIFLTFGRSQSDLLFVSGEEIGNQAGRDSGIDTI
jgi:hypothetical protein